MHNFDFSLRPIKDMQPFDNLFDSDSDYMQELSSLPKIELEAEALYTLDVTPRILFTPKLRYYRRLLEKEVNRHLNRAHKLMEGEGHENLSKYIIKQTREAVITLAKEYNSYLVQVDETGDYWKSLTSDNPDYTYTPVCEPPCLDHLCSGTIISPKELVVFYHNAIAELARCLLELQDRYAYLIGTDGLYDVSLFYSSIIGCSQDRIILPFNGKEAGTHSHAWVLGEDGNMHRANPNTHESIPANYSNLLRNIIKFNNQRKLKK